MSDKIIHLHDDRMAKVIADMTGPARTGNDVIIDGRCVPDLEMRDHGDSIEFVLDQRFSYTFPKDLAYLAASFAFHSMAHGAGHPSPGAPHKSTGHFAAPCVGISIEPEGAE